MFRFTFILCLFFFHCTGTFRAFSEPGGRVHNFAISSSSSVVIDRKYKILQKSRGKSSTLYILGAFPVTRPLNPDFAISQALAKVPKGQNIINVQIWIEKQYFFPLGTIFSLNVEGDVIEYL